MSKYAAKYALPAIALMAALATATPAAAQLGSVTGSVDGTVNGTVNSTVRTRSRIDTPKAPSVKATAPAKATVRAESRSRSGYSGSHYHGAYYHDHGSYGYDHFHSDPYSHTHGYAQVVVKVESAPQSIGPLLTYGTEVRSKKGKDLGNIKAMMRTEDGRVTHVLADGVSKPIPVDTLRADGDVLFTSLKKKKLKG